MTTDDRSRAATSNAQDLFEEVKDLITRSNNDLPNGGDTSLAQRLQNHRDVFATSDLDIGSTSLARHSIEMGAAKLIRQSPRPLPLAKKEQVR